MKFLKTIILISLISLQSIVAANDIQTEPASTKENVGFGIGALIGGVLAGPIGVVIGAGGGTWLGAHENKTDKTIASLEKELNAKSIEIAYQQNELAETKEKYKKEFQKVILNKETRSLEKLSDGISYVIYYKTNEAEIQHTILSEIKKLANLIKIYPQIQIQISGYTDYRGSDSHNLILSKERIDNVRAEFMKAGISSQRFQTHAYGERKASANEGETESYVFDRRVTINLTLNQET
jgi:sortase system peptidoglycan-associated protein